MPSRLLRLVLALVAVSAVLPIMPPARADATLEPVGEFRPFGAHNKIGGAGIASRIDDVRDRWFFSTPVNPTTGASEPHVWLFDTTGSPRQVGAPLKLGTVVPNSLVVGLDERGRFLQVYGDKPYLGIIEASPSGPRLAGSWDMSGRLIGANGSSLEVRGLTVQAGKAYLAAHTTSPTEEEVQVLQVDIDRAAAGLDAFDWSYRVENCPQLVEHYGQAAVGKSPKAPVLSLPCSNKTLPLAPALSLQGVALVSLGVATPSSSQGFTEDFYPISGDYGTGDSWYDPVADRISLRRTGPSQLVVFDVGSRHWLRPIVFGRENMYQAVLDHRSGRLYGHGNDPASGADQEWFFVPETHPTPAQNGLIARYEGPTPGSTLAAVGEMALDSKRRLLYVADMEALPGTSTRDGLFFRIYRDARGPLDTARTDDPDDEILNLSAESQGYGARVSYVGGVAGASYNYTFSYFLPAVGPGSRHATFARTLRMRMTEAESSAEAIVAQPEGATTSELTTVSDGTGNVPGARQEPWPYSSVGCRDFGSAPTGGKDPSGGAEVSCDLDYPRTTSTAVYQAGDDPRNAPVQRASTSATMLVHRTKGVVTTVTSEGSLDLPGLVSIGRVSATATTYAAGKRGTASSTYTRKMSDVTIAGQPFCSSDCDPDEVAAAINEEFRPLTSAGVLVRASVPRPDPSLLASDGGVQAIVQRDIWDHEEDVGLHDGPDDRWELPAFVVTVYQDRRYPQHQVYSLAGVQAVSRLPRSLADRLDELAGPDDSLPGIGDIVAPTLSPAEFGQLVGPAGSSLSTPVRTGGRAGRRSGSAAFTERLAWTLASPFRSPAMLAIIAFLLVPVYLSSRRWVLLADRPFHAGDVDAG